MKPLRRGGRAECNDGEDGNYHTTVVHQTSPSDSANNTGKAREQWNVWDANTPVNRRRALRIVGGKYAGRDLTSPADFRVRPTAEHVRAAVLDALAGDLPNARVLDLFAGTGALGLEALSRGARTADFVEFRPASLHALRANVAALKLRDRTRIFKKDAVQFAAALSADSYDIAFVDPPYESRQLDLVLASWRNTGFSSVLIAEHARSHQLAAGAWERRFDDTIVTIYRR